MEALTKEELKMLISAVCSYRLTEFISRESYGKAIALQEKLQSYLKAKELMEKRYDFTSR